MLWFGLKKNLQELEKKIVTSFKNVKKENLELKKLVKDLQKDVKLDHDILLLLQGKLEAINNPEFKQPFKRLNTSKQKQKEALIDLDSFTPKEKTIIKTLLDNKDMALSYKDIAKILDKSPNTIRCQINTLKTKTGFLLEQVDNENNKRYKLKQDIPIKKLI